MTPHKQLFRHDPENGVWGDCARTVIACLLDLHPSEVPRFMEKCDPNLTDSDIKAEINAWLKSNYNMLMVSIPFHACPLEILQKCMVIYAPGVHYVLMGESRNGTNHVVICKDGQIVWDPALDDSGIVGPEPDNNAYWVEFLIPIL